jgi:hypothetical protein
MAQKLKALLTLTADLGSIPSRPPPPVLQATHNPSSRGIHQMSQVHMHTSR